MYQNQYHPAGLTQFFLYSLTQKLLLAGERTSVLVFYEERIPQRDQFIECTYAWESTQRSSLFGAYMNGINLGKKSAGILASEGHTIGAA